MKKILLLSLGLSIAFLGWSQSNPAPPKKDKKSEKKQRINALVKMEEEGELIFNKHNLFGIKLNTDGYGISFEKGKFITPRRTRIIQIELNEKKHPKEDKDAGSIDFFGNVNQFVFGKANNFYQLKGAYGQQYLIGGKSNKNGVAVSALWAGGISLGMEKPYYVDVQDRDTEERTRKKFTEIEDINKYNYLGASGFTVGWGEVKFNPGAHLKTALRFDYGRFNEVASAIEAGVNIEYYASEVEQMIQNNQHRLFFNAYVSLLFGKRK
ncbi:hypothetical protein [Flavihumibacter solisilvae]|uniref:Outer membrane protein beta-barrel domain-containing protein n=1 Tax=Flavihumibacter solisilvae TaxID=1349421 RepID=A0A0C1L1C8_9BACT|nr:hypothetical protein [Flavihumibacter solisilvae]KIC93832.1 hypothetical protein OI18_14640 [Flavihumibacter solisilvae]